MKKNVLKRIGICMASVVMFLASGCGAKVELTVNKDLSVDENSQFYLTEQEISQLINQYGPDVVEEPFRKVTINGKQYSRVMQQVYHYNQGESTMYFSEVNKKFILAGYESLPSLVGAMEADMVYSEDAKADFADATVHCPYPVCYTNGKVRPDGKTVDFDLTKIKEGESVYAVFDKSLYNVDKVDFSGVKNNKIYNTYKKVSVKTKGVLTYVDDIVLDIDEKMSSEGADLGSDNASDGYKNWYFGTDGVYKLQAKLLNGKMKTVKFTIDTTKPKTNMKNKTYKKGVKITFSDKIAGMKSATLNGEKIKSGKKVNQAGRYHLVLTDRAGNTNKVSFKVK